jgi:hypothetical protein
MFQSTEYAVAPNIAFLLDYCSGKGIHLLIIISGQGEKLETKLGL